ncbi:hypothetical protein TSUD_289000 [Trifolium subterraneum]|uniref:Reverse transcriptase zinc-binding domain-containing protein n=1 Tax=Trifolium subterraneum TaxID=3900 RepID=A0A2Z6MT14_TRISU|nr:hypothetical protein TSUD_289000 [Trifolium subterraneum]
MRSWVNGLWWWGLIWRRNFFVWEIPLAREMDEVLNNSCLVEEADRWVWNANVDDGFSVKSLYDWLFVSLVHRVTRTSLEVFAFSSIWKCAVPSKVSALAWQLFLDRIPTKDNLCHRRIIHIDEVDCAMGGGDSPAGCVDDVRDSCWEWEKQAN